MWFCSGLFFSLCVSFVNRQDSVVLVSMKTQTKTDLVPDYVKNSNPKLWHNPTKSKLKALRASNIS